MYLTTHEPRAHLSAEEIAADKLTYLQAFYFTAYDDWSDVLAREQSYFTTIRLFAMPSRVTALAHSFPDVFPVNEWDLEYDLRSLRREVAMYKVALLKREVNMHVSFLKGDALEAFMDPTCTLNLLEIALGQMLNDSDLLLKLTERVDPSARHFLASTVLETCGSFKTLLGLCEPFLPNAVRVVRALSNA